MRHVCRRRGVRAVFSAGLLLCLLLQSVLPALGAQSVFSDVQSGSWYYDAVQYSAGAGWFTGTGAHTFSPDSTLTREMYVTVLYRYADSGAALTAAAGELHPFGDVAAGSWYEPAVQWAYDNGIVFGVSPDTFGVGQAVSREAVCAMTVRFLEKCYAHPLVTQEPTIRYVDVWDISEYARQDVEKARQYGIMSGCGANTFLPRAQMTRAQAAQLLYNLSAAKFDFEALHQWEEQTEYAPATGGIRYDTLERCCVCGAVRNRTAHNGRLPVLELTGDVSGISKENEVTLQASYLAADQSFSSVCTLKWQGASSLAYEKKNFNIKFYQDETLAKKNKLDVGWGKENKYTLKANYIDYTQSHNIVSAKLWGDIVKTRASQPQPLVNMVNGGAIDGFPVMLYINSMYQGLYTFNIPKDKWSMEDDAHPVKALVSTNDWSDTCNFRAQAQPDAESWEIEENEMESDEAVFDSINQLIRFVREHSGEDFRSGIGTYLDVESYIDYMCFTMAGTMRDNVAKNCMFVTYDGVKWYLTVYDLDSSWGLYWDGTQYYSAQMLVPYISGGSIRVNEVQNLLWERMFACYAPEIRARYFALRGSVLSNEAILKKFDDFNAMIPAELIEAEKMLYPNMPGFSVNTDAAMRDYLAQHMSALDRAIGMFPEN